LYGLREVVVAIAVDIQAQHKLHAAALVDAIEELGGTPVDEAEVAEAFTPPQGLVDNPTISNVLKFAASAERGAAVAYNQVLATMADAKLRFLASSIEGDETQHFIVLTALVLGLADPGPNLAVATAGDVVPQPFVSKVGNVNGLNAAPADYFP
jgi:ferritin-like protein